MGGRYKKRSNSFIKAIANTHDRQLDSSGITHAHACPWCCAWFKTEQDFKKHWNEKHKQYALIRKEK
jgi:uncharacterized C2H2 Zn-finger protein